MPDAQQPGAEKWLPDRPTLPALRAAVPSCRGCELWHDATQAVFSAGTSSARIAFVGEQPGDQEDREGKPFVGPAGRVLDEALVAAEIDRRDVYVTNAVKHFRHHIDRGSKRRIHDKPSVGQVNACHPWLAAEFAVVEPDLVVCLGATAGRSVLGRPVRIAAERGHVLDIEGFDAKALVTTHPSAVLRLRGRDGYDEAFDGFVSDLEAARRFLSG
jgi:uracil-DNA glycosylase family protein